MNDVTLLGNLTANPEVRYIENKGRKIAVANFTVAVNESFKRANGEWDKETTFVNCEAWDSGAETIGTHFAKGNLILLKGSLREDKWEKEGVKHSRMKIRVRTFKKLAYSPKTNTETAEQTEEVPY